MTLPWSRNFPSPGRGQACRIQELVGRAITVQQLRELAMFLESLTKKSLLLNTTEFSKLRGYYDKTITWIEINMYQITDEVIKKAIPFVDPSGEIDPCYETDTRNRSRRWYSWVEFVATKAQPVKVHLSHWWGGRFRDFMSAVESLVADKSLSVTTPIWICTFAICQFGENFGSKLEDCPFVQALNHAELMVLVVDREAGSLTRSWCGLEVHHAIMHEMEFELYTSAGRVGSSFVSGGPLVEAIRGWDIRDSQTSDPPYRRMILNLIAGVSELDGLMLREDGSMETDTIGRPCLDPAHSGICASGDEYEYEQMLFREHARRFEDLNMIVRLSVMRYIDLGRRPKGCAGKGLSVEQKGVTLGQLRAASRKLQATCPWTESLTPWWREDYSRKFEKGVVQFSELDLYMVVDWVRHLTHFESCSFMELIADGPQLPLILLDGASADLWCEFLEVVELFAEAMHLPDSTVFWFHPLSLNHNETGTRLARPVSKGGDRDIMQLPQLKALEECQSLLRVFSNPEDVKRGWELFKLEMAMRTGKHVYFGCSKGVMACNHPFRNGKVSFGRFNVEICDALIKLDAHDMICTKDSDRRAILDYFQQNAGTIALFNARVRRWCAGPLFRKAGLYNDVDLVVSMCRLPGLRLNSIFLKGAHLETALHTAAASGSLDVLRFLLRAKMDPDAEDNNGETPLHYAAGAGKVDAINVLLEAKADPMCESHFAERPLQVAENCAAGFLGICTHQVFQALDNKMLARSARNRLSLLGIQDGVTMLVGSTTHAKLDLSATGCSLEQGSEGDDTEHNVEGAARQTSPAGVASPAASLGYLHGDEILDASDIAQTIRSVSSFVLEEQELQEIMRVHCADSEGRINCRDFLSWLQRGIHAAKNCHDS